MTKAETQSPGGRLGPGLLFALLVATVYFDPLFLRRNFAGRDLLPYHLPIEKQVHDAYSRGRLPVWSSDISGGRPLLPNPNVGALYPLRPALAVFPFPLAFRIFPVLHWIGAGLGMMALLAALGAGRSAGWVGAVSYVFSGVAVSEVFFTNLEPGMMLLPWILWATTRCRRPGGVLVLALLYALDLLAGDVFTIAIALGSALLWIALETPARERLRHALAAAAAFGLALLLAAPQVVASALWAPQTRRGVVGLKLDEALTFTPSPWRLLEIAVPYPFGATWSLDSGEIWGRLAFRNFYASFYAGALAFVAAAALWNSTRRGARWARAMLLLSILFCLLPGLVPRSWGGRVSPIPLRYPEKMALGIVFALAVLAGLGLERFRGEARLPRWILAAGALLALLAGIAALFPRGTGAAAAAAIAAPPPAAADAARQLPGAFAEAGLFWMATLVALEAFRSGRRPAAVGALALLTAVPILANRRVAITFPESDVFSPTPFARALARQDPSAAGRVLDQSRYRPDSTESSIAPGTDPGELASYRRSWFFYTSSFWDRGTVFNTDPDVGDLSRMQSLREYSSFVAASPAGATLFANLSLRFGIRFRGQEALPGFRRFGGDAAQEWDENPLALPPVRLLERCREEPGAVAAFQVLPGLAPGEVAIETGERHSGSCAGGRVKVVEDSPERLRLSVEAPAPTWLFVLRGFWPYRDVRVDGQESEVFPASLAFSALRIPGGAREVVWRESVPGLAISWLGPAAFAVVGAAALLRRRREPAAAPSS